MGRHNLLLEAYGCRWYRVGGLDYLLQRSDIDKEDAQAKLRVRGTHHVPLNS